MLCYTILRCRSAQASTIIWLILTIIGTTIGMPALKQITTRLKPNRFVESTQNWIWRLTSWSTVISIDFDSSVDCAAFAVTHLLDPSTFQISLVRIYIVLACVQTHSIDLRLSLDRPIMNFLRRPLSFSLNHHVRLFPIGFFAGSLGFWQSTFCVVDLAVDHCNPLCHHPGVNSISMDSIEVGKTSELNSGQ